MNTIAPIKKWISADPDQILSQEYEKSKKPVINAVASKLVASKVEITRSDLEACYNQAWYGIYKMLANGEHIENLTGMLISVTHRRAIDEYRKTHISKFDIAADVGDLSSHSDMASELDDQMQVRQLLEGMRGTLRPRELEAAALCYVYGYSRDEAALQVGVRPKRMSKIMDSVSVKLRPVIETIKSGEWCESKRELMNDYAAGLLEAKDPRHQEAILHLRECSGCRRYVLGARGIMALGAPPAGIAMTLAAGGTGASGAGAGHSGGGSVSHGAMASTKAVIAGVSSVAVAAAVAAAVVINPFSRDTDSTRPATAAPPAVVKVEKPAQKSKTSKERANTHKATKSEASAPSPVAQPPAQEIPAEPAIEEAPEPEPVDSSPDREFDLQ